MKFEMFIGFVKEEFDKLLLFSLILFTAILTVILWMHGAKELANWAQRGYDNLTGALVAILTGRVVKHLGEEKQNA